MDLHYYPLDVQNCTVEIESCKYPFCAMLHVQDLRSGVNLCWDCISEYIRALARKQLCYHSLLYDWNIAWYYIQLEQCMLIRASLSLIWYQHILIMTDTFEPSSTHLYYDRHLGYILHPSLLWQTFGVHPPPIFIMTDIWGISSSHLYYDRHLGYILHLSLLWQTFGVYPPPIFIMKDICGITSTNLYCDRHLGYILHPSLLWQTFEVYFLHLSLLWQTFEVYPPPICIITDIWRIFSTYIYYNRHLRYILHLSLLWQTFGVHPPPIFIMTDICGTSSTIFIMTDIWGTSSTHLYYYKYVGYIFHPSLLWETFGVHPSPIFIMTDIWSIFFTPIFIMTYILSISSTHLYYNRHLGYILHPSLLWQTFGV